MKKILVSALFAVLALAPLAAHAERKNPLEGQPAVRHKVEFLKGRFEVTPRLGLTFLQDFKHNFLVGASLGYHITSWLSIGAFFDYAALPWDTELTNEIESTLPDRLNPNTTVDPSPSKRIMHNALDTLLFQAGVYLAYSPWFGKLSLFGKVFGNFDFYFLTGAGFAMLKAGEMRINSNCSVDADIDPTGLCSNRLYLDRRVENGGFKVGPLIGAGIRIQLLRWLALHFTFNAMFIQRNSAGFDRTGDTIPGTSVLIVDKKDNSWESLMSFNIGVTFLFPMKAPRTP
ncbi:MAG: outer membrane beta-barrel domain-containing protein [Polyangia bacterium]|jgi:outer membrane beta-barrel protein|nr:outer membrane beta-barrel domain-containing protein [Polyangia bacterium]